ncbi:MAG: class I SAM-dependent methyltransferase [Nitrosarchaeum sp.]|nr:class I SAM-dependent methyltransferase [Nitrosarchaeum sp.]
MPENKKEFPDWDVFYGQNDVKTMPWYEKNLDLDMVEEIQHLDKGRFLDLGTGPGTQAIELAKKGFIVTGSDVSPSAIKKAKSSTTNVNFVIDDILNSKFERESFDYILDRGCFHVLSVDERITYLSQIKQILKKNGMIFLKCMSKNEKNLPEDKGPHKFDKEEIINYFKSDFEIKKSKDTVYYGTLKPLPKALFFVMKKSEDLT